MSLALTLSMARYRTLRALPLQLGWSFCGLQPCQTSDLALILVSQMSMAEFLWENNRELGRPDPGWIRLDPRACHQITRDSCASSRWLHCPATALYSNIRS